VPTLRFPQFKNSDEWSPQDLGDCLDYLQPTEYLVNSTAYNDKHETPVVTAGKTFILGYTNETEGVFNEPLPVIIFDDFTTASQFVDFPFKAKSSAMKILLAKKNANIKFLYESMQQIDYEVGAHGRHWISSYSRIKVAVPEPSEQQKIADCLSSLDELIAAQARKVVALKIHKKGLMQQLFPREGETQPRLRFPEFRNAGEWEVCELGNVSDVRDGTHDSPSFFSTGRALVTSKNLRSDGTLDLENVNLISEEDYSQINKRSRVSIGDILFGMIGTIGNPVLVKSDGFAIKNVALIKEVGALSNSFLVQLLQSGYVAAIFAVLNTGNSQKFIALGKIRGLPVPVPSLPEQQLIAACFTSLDTLITAATQDLETVKTHKKGLMQQLFPPVDNEVPA